MAVAFAQPVDILAKMMYKSPTAAMELYQAEKMISSGMKGIDAGYNTSPWKNPTADEIRQHIFESIENSKKVREASQYGDYLKIEQGILRTLEKKKWFENLKNTDNFKQGTKENALSHIFDGEILKNGNANGFHYEGMPNSNGKIVGNIDPPNKFGVYQANIEVNGVLKKVKSTFFPKEWAPQQVIDAINEAFNNKVLVKNNIYQGKTSTGIKIEFVLRNDKIISAYPLYQVE
ncbi:EndoU domain-containing protein [Paenibacillus lentus]|uniref:EndoU domain-containing protein n=1 Tax=Paenibacillus lentus TaxID=1338368 RepID=UPI003663AB0B